MNYYLIDFENIHSEGLEKLKDIKPNDTIIIFYSDSCKNISLDNLSPILNKQVSYKSFKVSIGTKNALDFQLASYLGYLIGKEPSANYYIVSNDKGFDYLLDYWERFSINVEKIKTQAQVIVPAPIKKKNKVKTSDLASIEEINNLLSSEEKPEKVLKIINQYKTKLAINNGLTKEFKDGKIVSTIYKKLKPLLKEKNKT